MEEDTAWLIGWWRGCSGAWGALWLDGNPPSGMQKRVAHSKVLCFGTHSRVAGRGLTRSTPLPSHLKRYPGRLLAAVCRRSREVEEPACRGTSALGAQAAGRRENAALLRCHSSILYWQSWPWHVLTKEKYSRDHLLDHRAGKEEWIWSWKAIGR